MEKLGVVELRAISVKTAYTHSNIKLTGATSVTLRDVQESCICNTYILVSKMLIYNNLNERHAICTSVQC